MSYLSCSSCVLFVPFSFSTLVFFISFLTFIFHLLSLYLFIYFCLDFFFFFKYRFRFKKKIFFFTLMNFVPLLPLLFIFVFHYHLSLSMSVLLTGCGKMAHADNWLHAFAERRVFMLQKGTCSVLTAHLKTRCHNKQKKHKQTKKMLHSFS